MPYSKGFFPAIEEILRVSIAVSYSLQLAFRYRTLLEIRPGELLEYMRKSVRLALCYQGFGKGLDFKEAEMAGRAAFLSCAYDVATDWRDDDAKWFKSFGRIVRTEATGKLAAMALNLYRKDSAGTLANDGLERGIIAFHFVLEMMGLTRCFRQITDTGHLGLVLQVVDDVLDYKIDSRSGDWNCINSPRGRYYLRLLIAELGDERVRLLFPESRVLLRVIKKSRWKAHKLLEETDAARLENTRRSRNKVF